MTDKQHQNLQLFIYSQLYSQYFMMRCHT